MLAGKSPSKTPGPYGTRAGGDCGIASSIYRLPAPGTDFVDPQNPLKLDSPGMASGQDKEEGQAIFGQASSHQSPQENVSDSSSSAHDSTSTAGFQSGSRTGRPDAWVAGGLGNGNPVAVA